METTENNGKQLKTTDHLSKFTGEVQTQNLDNLDILDVFGQLFNELFVKNYMIVGEHDVFPFNVDLINKKIRQKVKKEKKEEMELYNSLIKVKEAIEIDGGISEKTYEEYKYAINSLARDLTEQRWWGSNQVNRCEKQDKEGKSPTTEQIARFPEDGDFSENGHTNIFDEKPKMSFFEGTLFQREYDENSNLEFFRLFHQGHRDELTVKTVDIEELVSKINSFVTDFVDEVPTPDFGFTLSAEEYREKIEQFNKLFAPDIMSLEIKDNEAVLIKFTENPKQLAEMIVKNGKDIELNKGPMTYSVSSTGEERHIVDIFATHHFERELERRKEPFDPEIHKDSGSIIVPYTHQKFLKKLLQLIISQKAK